MIKQKIYKLLLLLIAATCSAGAAYAQRGMTQVGADFAYLYNINYSKGQCGANVKILHNCSNHYRIGLTGGISSSVGKTDMFVEFDQHILVGKVKRFRPYFILGLGYGKFTTPKFLDVYFDYVIENGRNKYEKKDVYDLKSQPNCLLGRAGFGADVRIMPYLSLQIELTGLATIPTVSNNDNYFVKYRFPGPKFNVGLTYNF